MKLIEHCKLLEQVIYQKYFLCMLKYINLEGYFNLKEVFLEETAFSFEKVMA
jgi:hypothetical protein